MHCKGHIANIAKGTVQSRQLRLESEGAHSGSDLSPPVPSRPSGTSVGKCLPRIGNPVPVMFIRLRSPHCLSFRYSLDLVGCLLLDWIKHIKSNMNGLGCQS